VTDARRQLRTEARALVALRNYVDATAALWVGALPNPDDATLCQAAQLEASFLVDLRQITDQLIEFRLERVPAAVAVAAEQAFDDFAAAHPLDD
jgi:hypothetical protein